MARPEITMTGLVRVLPPETPFHQRKLFMTSHTQIHGPSGTQIMHLLITNHNILYHILYDMCPGSSLTGPDRTPGTSWKHEPYKVKLCSR